MQIPYTSTARPDTGLYNAKLGIWLFLASEVMLFGALFSTYVLLRVGAPTWPHGYEHLNIPLATVNTVILISSSVTMVMSWASLMMGKFTNYRRYMGLTILLGLCFLGIKGVEYGTKFSHGLYPSESTFLAIYFTLTGLHGLHVIGGIVVNSYNLGRGSRLWKSDPQRFTNRVEVAGLYWHFVDLVWMFIFPLVYLMSTRIT